MNTNHIVYESLKGLGMPMNMKGYPLISKAISMCLEKPELIGEMNTIYSQLAEEQGIPFSTVVRNIVYCIGVTLSNSAQVEEYFGARVHYENIKPNEFIAGVCEHIRMKEIKKEASEQ